MHNISKNPRSAPTGREAVSYEICIRWTKQVKIISGLCSVPTGHQPTFSIRISGRELHTAEFRSALQRLQNQ